MISVFDYGAGNLQSVKNTLGAIGAEYELIRDAGAVRRAKKIILPGVGHFGQMMRSLDSLGVRDALMERVRAGVPFLGICLGLQALFERSEEEPGERGLALYPGNVKRFQGDVRIPHMGWNQLEPRRSTRLLQGLDQPPFVYFANSYYCPVIDATGAACTYTLPFTALLEDGNVAGVQFHPEKSGPIGLKIVENFVKPSFEGGAA